MASDDLKCESNGNVPMGSLFPMPAMRDGQREFYLDAKEAAEGGMVLLANAPTGIGKTAAALSAVLESAIPAGRKVIFVTNRSSHHLQAMEEIRKMNSARSAELGALRFGMRRILAIDKIGKERMCIHRLRNRSETGALRCELSRSFCAYSRPKEEAITGLLEGDMGAGDANAFCAQKSSCPHFTALGAMARADLIIADYRYLFDEGVRGVFLQNAKIALDKLDVIIDEAHNLPDAVREMSSPSIDQDSCRLALSGIAAARKLARRMKDDALAETFSAPHDYIKGTLSALMEEIALSGKEGAEVPLSGGALAIFRSDHYAKSTLGANGREVVSELERASQFLRDAVSKEGMREDFTAEGVEKMGELAAFLKSASAIAEGSKSSGLFAKNEGDDNFTLKCVLYDPSEVSYGVFSALHSAVLMSGTLIGKKALVDLLGLEPARVLRQEESSYASAFPQNRHPIAICTAASSRFSERGLGGSVGMMARVIAESSRAAWPHSVAVFYPSYDYMAMVHKELALPEFLHESETRLSTGKAGERKARLESGVEKGAMMFHAVIGGSFSEGVDFKKNPFKLIIVAGFPHPKSDGQHSAYETYLGLKFKSRHTADLYASMYPAIIRSVQALGRGIRSETDWCFGLLLDDRFEKYGSLLPEGIRAKAKRLSPSETAKNVHAFKETMAGGKE